MDGLKSSTIETYFSAEGTLKLAGSSFLRRGSLCFKGGGEQARDMNE